MTDVFADGETAQQAADSGSEHEEDDKEDDQKENQPVADNVTKKTEPADDAAGVHTIPSDAILDQLVAQSESYFSDENIAKDAFLLKHIRKNKDGFVSLKLVASFRKIKKISKDWRDLAYAIEHRSHALELNKAGTKVRRLAPLPAGVEAPFSPTRSLVAVNLRADTTSETLTAQFSECGTVVRIQLSNPTRREALPLQLRQLVKAHQELLSSVCALVEFSHSSEATAAMRRLGASSKTGDWRAAVMKLIPLYVLERQPAVVTRGERRSVSESEAYTGPPPPTRAMAIPQVETSGSESGSPELMRRRFANQQKMKSAPKAIPSRVGGYRSMTPLGSDPDVRWTRHVEDSPLSSSPSSLGTSPWLLQRRLLGAGGPLGSGSLSSSVSSLPGATTGNTSGGIIVLREPLAPDGTKGFVLKRTVANSELQAALKHAQIETIIEGSASAEKEES